MDDFYRPTIVIREDKGQIIWTGVKTIKITSPSEALNILHDGSLLRQTGQTSMNIKSSRSHAIFTLYLTRHQTMPTGENITVSSKLHFVDLAGSERLKRTNLIGDRAKEGISHKCRASWHMGKCNISSRRHAPNWAIAHPLPRFQTHSPAPRLIRRKFSDSAHCLHFCVPPQYQRDHQHAKIRVTCPKR